MIFVLLFVWERGARVETQPHLLLCGWLAAAFCCCLLWEGKAASLLAFGLGLLLPLTSSSKQQRQFPCFVLLNKRRRCKVQDGGGEMTWRKNHDLGEGKFFQGITTPLWRLIVHFGHKTWRTRNNNCHNHNTSSMRLTLLKGRLCLLFVVMVVVVVVVSSVCAVNDDHQRGVVWFRFVCFVSKRNREGEF